MPSRPPDSQLDLFGGAGEGAPGVAPVSNEIGAAPVPAAHQDAARKLPPGLRMGTSSWFFPGWEGIVYDRSASKPELSRHGLKPYARHPLLRAVGIDRTFYAPVSSDVFKGYAADVPQDFRFVVKAHDALTLARFPAHARYGAKAGQPNPLFLDAAYATDAVVQPYVEGLGPKGGALVFQFSPQAPDLLDPQTFPDRLYRFLSRLPKGPVYAVEVRNGSLLTPRYARALAAAGAVHAPNVWGPMPDVETQARLTGALGGRALVIRWMLPEHLSYEEAKVRYAPFTRLVDVDPRIRGSVLRLCAQAVAAGTPAYVIVNNKAEGSAPLTVFELSQAFASRRGA